ncbi:MAG: hypothetical protein IGQ45_10205 [Cyanobacterium sp. T60_A2020_053]|nr:hypothetical protein [Cyanobacterium sp. T60_A2020_053]
MLYLYQYSDSPRSVRKENPHDYLPTAVEGAKNYELTTIAYSLILL